MAQGVGSWTGACGSVPGAHWRLSFCILATGQLGPWHLISGGFSSWGLMGAGASRDGHILSLRCECAWAPTKDPPPFFCQAAVITPVVRSLFQEAGQLLGKVRGEVGSLRAGGLRLPLCSLIWADGDSTAPAPGDQAVARAALSLSRWPWVSPRGTTHLPQEKGQVQVVCAL